MAITKSEIAEILRSKRPSLPYKLSDGGGLYIYVTPTALLWRYDYRLKRPGEPDDGKRKTRSYGEYGDQLSALDLDRARRLQSADRITVAEGGDPAADVAANRQATSRVRHAIRQTSRRLTTQSIKAKPKGKTAQGAVTGDDAGLPSLPGSFGFAADGWDTLMKKQAEAGKRSPKTRARDERMVRYLKNSFGLVELCNVEVPHLSTLLDVFEGEDKYTTRQRLQSTAVNVMGFAQGKGWIKTNPFLGINFGKAYTAPLNEPRPAIIEPEPFGQLLRDVAAYNGRQGNLIGAALDLLCLTLVRPGNVVACEWSEIDLDKAVWTIPFVKLKQRSFRETIKELKGKPHYVPLSKQAVTLLRNLKGLTGSASFVFATADNISGHITTEGLESAVNLLGYKDLHCPHGFRSSASTLLNAERVTVEGTELPRFAEQAIEFQLEHVEKSVAAIYNRNQRLPERVRMMQFWADSCDAMRGGSRAKLRVVA